MQRLKALKLFLSRSLFVSLDHKKGPRYFRECFLCFTVLKRDKVNSEFLNIYRRVNSACPIYI